MYDIFEVEEPACVGSYGGESRIFKSGSPYDFSVACQKPGLAFVGGAIFRVREKIADEFRSSGSERHHSVAAAVMPQFPPMIREGDICVEKGM